MHTNKSEPLHSCLIFGPSRAAVPLVGVEIRAQLFGPCSEVTVTQRYRNSERVPVECVYVFPLEEAAAVSGFRARVGERVIEGRVEERERAFEMYDDALAEGHGAFLLDQERPNIFTASVGNLEPGQEVAIAITYVALSAREGRAVRFALPTTVSPRYVPAAGAGEAIAEPDSERVNPERWSQVPYGLTLTVDLDMDSDIRMLESPSHAIRTELDRNRGRVTLATRETALDRDFVLLCETREADQPCVRVARESDGTRVAMVSFAPRAEDLPKVAGSEIVFLLDCSGSMMGDSIDEARRALALCVRAMSEDDTFNIIRFGSRFTSLWPESRAYSERTLAEATRYIQAANADLGGTEILAPLEHITRQPVDGVRPRQVLLLTDGQVSNEDAVIALCREHANATRVFAFGIGAGASEHLVRGVARASRGAAEFIHPGERIEPKVLRMFGRVSTPALTDVHVDWGDYNAEQAPASVPPVFAGDVLTVFARISGGSSTRVSLRSREHTWEMAMDIEQAIEDRLLPTLWARAMIRDLESHEGAPRGSAQGRRRDSERTDRRRERVVELGVRYGLMSSATSYVAVEVRAPHERTTAQAELRRVPIALTSGWGGHGSALAGGAGMRAQAGLAPTGMPMASMAMAPSNFAPGAPPAAPPRPAAPAPARARPMSARPPAPPREYQASIVSSGVYESEDMESDFFDGDAGLIRSEAAPAASSDWVFDLLLTQNADGSFPESHALLTALGSRSADFQTAAAAHGSALVATAVVLRLLEQRAPERRAEWTPAARKAQRWLDRQTQAFDASALV